MGLDGGGGGGVVGSEVGVAVFVTVTVGLGVGLDAVGVGVGLTFVGVGLAPGTGAALPVSSKINTISNPSSSAPMTDSKITSVRFDFPSAAAVVAASPEGGMTSPDDGKTSVLASGCSNRSVGVSSLM